MSDHSAFTSGGVELAFTGTLHGLTESASADEWTSMESVVDLIHVTYYPIDSNFQVEDPSVVTDDLQALVDKFSAPIYLQEVGYQSSSTSNSSKSKQAEFFCNFFQAWDTHASEIPRASILRFNDVSQSSAESTATTYGVSGNQNFIEYIRTLGLRTYSGTGSDKSAFSIVDQETEKRGW